MTVYHGTTLEIIKPEIIKSEIGRDFGFAFYTTDIKEQAERWAVRRAKMFSRITGKLQVPIVNIYNWKHERDTKFKQFNGVSMEWLDMVVECRNNPEYVHGYDIVEGKIANDNVGETVSYVVQGIMRKEDAIERLKFEKINNQIAFCTKNALDELEFVDSYSVKEDNGYACNYKSNITTGNN